MWISKKKLEKIEREINVLKRYLREYDLLENTINKLVDAHNEIEVEEEYIRYPSNPYELYTFNKRMTKRYTHSSSTEHIPDITLEELARLVIDGTPIVRDKKIDVKMYYGGDGID